MSTTTTTTKARKPTTRKTAPLSKASRVDIIKAALSDIIAIDAKLTQASKEAIDNFKRLVTVEDITPVRDKDQKGYDAWCEIRDHAKKVYALHFMGIEHREYDALIALTKPTKPELRLRQRVGNRCNSWLNKLRNGMIAKEELMRNGPRDFKTRTLEAIANMTKSIRKEELANKAEIIAALTVVEKLIAKL
jgi:hypothetical protein